MAEPDGAIRLPCQIDAPQRKDALLGGHSYQGEGFEVADKPINVMAQEAPPKANPWAKKPKGEAPAEDRADKSGEGRKDRVEDSRSPQFQRPNPQTNAGGVPRPTARGERQLDGSRTTEFSQPQKKPGLPPRGPAPAASSGGSGLEAAMAAEADRLHPPKRRG